MTVDTTLLETSKTSKHLRVSPQEELVLRILLSVWKHRTSFVLEISLCNSVVYNRISRCNLWAYEVQKLSCKKNINSALNKMKFVSKTVDHVQNNFMYVAYQSTCYWVQPIIGKFVFTSIPARLHLSGTFSPFLNQKMEKLKGVRNILAVQKLIIHPAA